MMIKLLVVRVLVVVVVHWDPSDGPHEAHFLINAATTTVVSTVVGFQWEVVVVVEVVVVGLEERVGGGGGGGEGEIDIGGGGREVGGLCGLVGPKP